MTRSRSRVVDSAVDATPERELNHPQSTDSSQLPDVQTLLSPRAARAIEASDDRLEVTTFTVREHRYTPPNRGWAVRRVGRLPAPVAASTSRRRSQGCVYFSVCNSGTERLHVLHSPNVRRPRPRVRAHFLQIVRHNGRSGSDCSYRHFANRGSLNHGCAIDSLSRVGAI